MLVWGIINTVLLIIGILFIGLFFITGSKSEAYNAFAWFGGGIIFCGVGVVGYIALGIYYIILSI
jgi:hypothetical protein